MHVRTINGPYARITYHRHQITSQLCTYEGKINHTEEKFNHRHSLIGLQLSYGHHERETNPKNRKYKGLGHTGKFTDTGTKMLTRKGELYRYINTAVTANSLNHSPQPPQVQVREGSR